MSLINQMLKDLETQYHKRSRISPLSGLSSSIVKNEQTNWSKIILAGGLFILCIAGLALFNSHVPRQSVQRSQLDSPIESANDRGVRAASDNRSLPKSANDQATSTQATIPESTTLTAAPTPKQESVNTHLNTAAMQKNIVPLSSQELLKKRYQQALTLIRDQQTIAASHLLNDILASNQRFIPARISLVSLLIQQEKMQRAQSILQQGLQLAPNNTELIKLQARLFIKSNQFQKASQLLQHNAPTMDEDPDYYALLAGIYTQQGQAKLAISLYQQLLKIQPTNGTWWMGLAITLEQTQQHQQAIRAYQHALDSRSLKPTSQIFITERLNILRG